MSTSKQRKGGCGAGTLGATMKMVGGKPLFTGMSFSASASASMSMRPNLPPRLWARSAESQRREFGKRVESAGGVLGVTQYLHVGCFESDNVDAPEPPAVAESQRREFGECVESAGGGC